MSGANGAPLGAGDVGVVQYSCAECYAKDPYDGATANVDGSGCVYCEAFLLRSATVGLYRLIESLQPFRVADPAMREAKEAVNLHGEVLS